MAAEDRMNKIKPHSNFSRLFGENNLLDLSWSLKEVISDQITRIDPKITTIKMVSYDRTEREHLHNMS